MGASTGEVPWAGGEDHAGGVSTEGQEAGQEKHLVRAARIPWKSLCRGGTHKCTRHDGWRLAEKGQFHPGTPGLAPCGDRQVAGEQGTGVHWAASPQSLTGNLSLRHTHNKLRALMEPTAELPKLSSDERSTCLFLRLSPSKIVFFKMSQVSLLPS